MTTTDPEKKLINKNLLSFKLLTFLFFGALLCLWPHLPLHMTHLKFNIVEIKNITIFAALISVLGPFTFGLILDRIAAKNSAAYGKYVKIFLITSLLLAGTCYTLLLVVVSPIQRTVTDFQPVTFGCDSNGGLIYQKKCEHQTECLNLKSTKGSLHLKSCSYTCQKPLDFEDLYESSVLKLIDSLKVKPQLDAYKVQASSESEYDENYENSLYSSKPQDDYDTDVGEDFDEDEDQSKRRKRNVKVSRVYVEPPHICLRDGKNTEAKPSDRYTCHAYTIDTKLINLNVESSGLNYDANDTADFCQHRLEHFKCNIPEPQKVWMRFFMNSLNCDDKNNTNQMNCCKPMIECEVHQPYEDADSFLSKTRCYKSVGNDSEIFLLYLIIRSLADLFALTSHSLINVAIVVATRETSIGRGNIGHQLSWGYIGTFFFAIIIGVINHLVDIDQFLIPMMMGPALIFVAALVVLFTNKFQKMLSPSEWWWHTKYGIVAIPMSAIRKYQILAFFIALLSLTFGIFWNVLEEYREIHTIDIIEWNLSSSIKSKTFCYAIGALFAIPIVWNAEKLVQLVGHSHIFIVALVTYIVRFSGIMSLKNPTVSLLELLEPISLALTWITLIFYLRHIIPKKFLASSQAVLVMFWFGFGRAIGWWLMGTETREHMYCVLSSLACVFAVLYFIVYHCILLPFYRIPSQALNDKSFAHERVFHDERSRKGFFKY